MTIDHHLSKKTYYETLFVDDKKGEPIEVLGEMFLKEHRKELSDLSYIRFAQGEIYYHFQDYEAAIFKWNNISNELQGWAMKNVGDAYFELNLLPTAIETYKSISADNLILQTEIALKLFQIYVEEDKKDVAIQYIKQAVSLNPDYQNITKIARIFFEQNDDDANAVELAVNECLRTESVDWFDILTQYVEKGRTKVIAPDYFSNVLQNLYRVDAVRFEKLVSALWVSYQYGEQYISWIDVLNNLFTNIDEKKSTAWNSISRLYSDSFKEFITGRYELKDMIVFMPKFLENWSKIVKPAEALWAHSALLTWNEFYPSSIQEEVIESSKNQIATCKKNPEILQDSLGLFQSIVQWATANDVEIGTKLRWFVQEILDLSKQNILVAGVNGTGKSSFINSLLGETLFEHTTSSTFRIKNGNVPQITVISDQEMYSETMVPDVVNVINNELDLSSKSIVDISIPSDILKEYGITLIDTPGFRARRDELEIKEFLPLADELLFVLDAEDPFTDQERDIMMQILQHETHLPITFVITKLDSIYNKQEAKKVVEDVTTKIAEYIPQAQVIPFSSKYEVSGQEKAVHDLFTSYKANSQIEEKRTEKLLHVIQRVISYLLKNRVEKENGYRDEIAWNEDMVKKLNGAINQVQENEEIQAHSICNKYRSIKKDIIEEMEMRIPQLLRGCGDLLKEDSDFRKIHLELNDEMNKRIQQYVDNEVLPRICSSMEEWIEISRQELIQSKVFLDEISESFNNLYGEEIMHLEGDFLILNDWERDMSRMTSGVKLERENILLRHTPSQFLLKSAGKLFGAISQNKTLYNQYKKFVENEEYLDTTNSVIAKLFIQYDLFEQAVERDVALFFKQALKELKEKVQDAHEEIKDKEELLNIMKTQPELYYDAVTLFKIRQRQYECMVEATLK